MALLQAMKTPRTNNKISPPAGYWPVLVCTMHHDFALVSRLRPARRVQRCHLLISLEVVPCFYNYSWPPFGCRLASPVVTVNRDMYWLTSIEVPSSDLLCTGTGCISLMPIMVCAPRLRCNFYSAQSLLCPCSELKIKLNASEQMAL